MLEIVAKCPGCDAGLPIGAAGAAAEITCGRCGRTIPLSFSTLVQEDRGVDACPVCGGHDFYSRKDFDPRIGLAVVSVGALISAAFYWFGRDLIAYLILALAALVDLLVYRHLGDLTVCYRCHSEFRGKYSRTARAFDLHTADMLEQEYERTVGRR